MHCKQRWHKINDLVCKFCGAYEAAGRERTSGQNENDILKQAHEIFFNNYKKNSHSSMRGKSSATTRNGVIYLLLKPPEALKRGSVRMVHNPQHLTQLTTRLVKRMRELLGPLVLRQRRAVVRRKWRRERG